MSRLTRFLLLVLCLSLAIETKAAENPQSAKALAKEGNWAEAYEVASRSLMSGQGKASDLDLAVDCLRQLGRVTEIDKLLESVVQNYSDNSTMLTQASLDYTQLSKQGYLINGEFHRGNQRGTGQIYNCEASDRIRAIRAAYAAVESANGDREQGNAYQALAHALRLGRHHQRAWLLQKKSDLETVPEPVEGWQENVATSAPPVTDEDFASFLRRS